MPYDPATLTEEYEHWETAARAAISRWVRRADSGAPPPPRSVVAILGVDVPDDPRELEPLPPAA